MSTENMNNMPEIIYRSDDNKRTVTVEARSTVYVPADPELNEACTYGKIIKLEHQEDPKNNGILIVTKENGAYSSKTKDFRYPIMRSYDDGATWTEVLRLTDLVNDNNPPLGYQPYFLELPEDVGNYKKGTILMAYCNWVVRGEKIGLPLMYSRDCGTTWEGVGNIAIGGKTAAQSWASYGVWEPVLLYENGRVYCFYSDELSKGEGEEHIGGHNQRIVYRYTDDLVNWCETKECISSANPNERPGMASLTKMGNGKWAVVYEHINVQIYIKFADTLDSWEPASDVGKRVENEKGNFLGSGPVIAWTPDGGECGTLFLTSFFSEQSKTKCDLFMSFDYGETFTSIDNPINVLQEQTGDYHLYGGYSPGMFVDKEGTLYYVNNPQSKERPCQENLVLIKVKVK